MTTKCRTCGTEIIFGSGSTPEERANPACTRCSRFWDAGSHDYVLGLDEVGWGALAGPLMVGAAIACRGWWWPELRDSKKLSAPVRERIVKDLTARGMVVHIEVMLVREFERFPNPEQALLETHRRAAARMLARYPNTLIIVDGNRRIPGIPCTPVVDADTMVPTVMAAAIFAKVRRDRYMCGLHSAFPAYRFNENAGYGKEQADLVRALGGSIVHRRNYKPLKEMLGAAAQRPQRMQQLVLPFGETR